MYTRIVACIVYNVRLVFLEIGNLYGMHVESFADLFRGDANFSFLVLRLQTCFLQKRRSAKFRTLTQLNSLSRYMLPIHFKKGDR